MDYFKRPTDEINECWNECYAYLHKYFFETKWYEVYDLMEFVAEYCPDDRRDERD
ncbi:MAG: hypothetical protein HC919_11630 [Oscillatoriales cyanobacterium SM2_2_1]|nr:hypothetical protein [Oscillatoriales cyanobacterium SM2_2_1]